MKILLLSPNFHPEKTGIGVSATESARFISSFGHDVEVITSLPHYPEWEILPEYRSKFLVTEQFEDRILVTRAWLYVPKKLRTWSRILHELTFASSTALVSLFRRCDLVLSISPPLSASAAMSLVAKIKRVPFWCYIQDIQPDAAQCLGMLKNPVLLAISKLLERHIYRSAEKLLVLSDGMKQNLLNKGVSADKIQILPLAVDVDELVSPLGGLSQASPNYPTDSHFRAQYALEDKFLVLYSGNIGIKHNPEILVECAQQLSDREDIFFAVVGDGAAKEILRHRIAQLELSNIQVFPLCEREFLGDMLQSADVLIVAQRKEVLDIVVPSKIVAYLTSKRPVVASVHPQSEAAVLLRDADAGIVVPPEDPHSMCEALLELFESPERARELGERGFELVEEQFSTTVVRQKYYAPLFDHQSPTPSSVSSSFPESTSIEPLPSTTPSTSSSITKGP